ncbi:MAG: HEAT repeat domain-containing protein [Candidatus Firestonebacteria bacterium]
MKKIVVFFVILFIFPVLIFSEDKRINQLKDTTESPLLRAALAKSLGKENIKEIGPIFLEIICNEKEDYGLRVACANQIGNFDSKEILFQLKDLIVTLKDSKGDIINGILDGISKSKYRKDKDILSAVGLFIKDKKSETRKKVIAILTESNDKSAIPFLMMAMEDKAHAIRKMAIQSVAKIGGKLAALAMIDALEEEKQEEIRDLIADILNKIEIPKMKKVWIETFEKRVEEENNPKTKLKLKSALERVKKAQSGK